MAEILSAVKKNTLDYQVFTGKNPVDGSTIYLPRIKNKGTMNTAQILQFCMDFGFVTGGQFNSNLGTVNGYFEGARYLLRQGNDLTHDGWMRQHIEVTGQVDPETLAIDTKVNKIHLCSQTLADFKLKSEDYSWHLVNDTGVQPYIQHLQSMGGKNDHEIFKSAKIIVSGTNLTYTASTDKVTAEWVTVATDGTVTPHSVQLVPESSGYAMMIIPWSTQMDEIPVGTEVTFTFFLKGGNPDVTALPAYGKATMVAAE